MVNWRCVFLCMCAYSLDHSPSITVSTCMVNILIACELPALQHHYTHQPTSYMKAWHLFPLRVRNLFVHISGTEACLALSQWEALGAKAAHWEMQLPVCWAARRHFSSKYSVCDVWECGPSLCGAAWHRATGKSRWLPSWRHSFFRLAPAPACREGLW